MTDANVSPFFSIIIPVYNREHLIVPAIQCVIDQSFSSWELLIIDDASTDNTGETIIKYVHTDKRIKYFKHEINKERGAARNTGIENAKGKYICFLDSDDFYLKNHLEIFHASVTQLQYPQALLFANTYLEDEKGFRIKKTVPDYSEEKKWNYLLQYTFNPTRVCVHHTILKQLKFDPLIPGLEDLDLWLRIANQFPLFQLFDYTSVYLVHDGSYSSGDQLRYQKELKNFNYIFSKKELINILPDKAKSRLLSMCHYHLAIGYEKKGESFKMFTSIINSFLLFPKGYNGKTNRVLFVMFTYHLPIIGWLLKGIVKLVKN